MGGLSCCENPDRKSQLIIEQIIAEDKIRVKSENTKNMNVNNKSIKNYNYHLPKIKRIQTIVKGFLRKKRFYKYFEIMKKMILEELKFNLTEREHLDYYVPEAIKKLEKSELLREYETTDFYFKNINKWKKNKFLIILPSVYVDKLHNNDIYKGSWNIEKKFHGYGILIKTDGCKYQGFWDNGNLNGVGRYFTPTGDFLEGGFINGVANGWGVFIHNDGTTYKGNWINDQPHGYGKEFFPDGSFFKGNFHYGKKNGKGHFTWKDGSSYSGNLSNEIFEGFGKYKWADQRVYEGNWLNNQMHGQGQLTYADGSYYKGEFVNNLRSGFGKYYWNDNKYYEGSWVNGKQEGKGVYCKNGKIVEGIWNNGKVQNHKVVAISNVKSNYANNNKGVGNSNDKTSCAVGTTAADKENNKINYNTNNSNTIISNFNESRDQLGLELGVNVNLDTVASYINTNTEENIKYVMITKTKSLKNLIKLK